MMEAVIEKRMLRTQSGAVAELVIMKSDAPEVFLAWSEVSELISPDPVEMLRDIISNELQSLYTDQPI